MPCVGLCNTPASMKQYEARSLMVLVWLGGSCGTWHSLHLLLWRFMCCSARTRLLMRDVSMFSKKLFSSSFAPTKGLLLHSRRPAARASSMGAAEAPTRTCEGSQTLLCTLCSPFIKLSHAGLKFAIYRFYLTVQTERWCTSLHAE